MAVLKANGSFLKANGKILVRPEGGDTVVIGGRTYRTVTIGNQIWLAENLDYKFEYYGSTLPIGVPGNPSTPAAWYYNNDELLYGIDGTYKCGLLYNWYAAKYLDVNKATLLPDGWHVPSVSEFAALIAQVGSNSGTKLKASDDSVIQGFPNGWNGSDDFGFSVLPAGGYFINFVLFGNYSGFWTNESANNDLAYAYTFNNTDNNANEITDGKFGTASMRLVKNA